MTTVQSRGRLSRANIFHVTTIAYLTINIALPQQQRKLREWAISELPFASVSKRIFVQGHSYLIKKCCADIKLKSKVLKQMYKVTGKWPVWN